MANKLLQCVYCPQQAFALILTICSPFCPIYQAKAIFFWQKSNYPRPELTVEHFL